MSRGVGVLSGGVPPPRRRVSFWMPRKKPKKHQGAAQDERSALIFAAPGPHLRGLPLGMDKNFRRAKFEWLVQISSGLLRRRGFRIPRFARLGKARSLQRSISALRAAALRRLRSETLACGRVSSPTQTRFAGLCVGGRLRRPIGVENFKWFGSATAPGFDEPTLLVRFPL